MNRTHAEFPRFSSALSEITLGYQTTHATSPTTATTAMPSAAPTIQMAMLADTFARGGGAGVGSVADSITAVLPTAKSAIAATRVSSPSPLPAGDAFAAGGVGARVGQPKASPRGRPPRRE
jgi:hypothetical protein